MPTEITNETFFKTKTQKKSRIIREEAGITRMMKIDPWLIDKDEVPILMARSRNAQANICRSQNQNNMADHKL